MSSAHSTMEKNSDYCYKGSPEFVIENGILKGHEEPYLTEHTSVGEYILDKLKATPEFIGQIDGKTGEKESFGKMMEKSVKCAMWLKQQNIQLGDIVGICTYNHMDMYVPFFATLYIGAVFNPWWNTGITKELAKHFLTLTSPKILFADEVSADLILEVAKEIEMPLKVIVFGNVNGFQSLDEILGSQDTKNVAEFRCTKLSSLLEPAVILYTSGSTGLPKGVLHSHKAQFRSLHSYRTIGRLEGTTIPLFYSPLAWGTAIAGILRATIRRETRIVCPVFSEETTFQLIEKFKINWLLVTASAVTSLLKSPARTKYDLSSLKYLYICGSVIKEDLHKKVTAMFPQTSVCQFYGSTESGLMCEQHGDNLKPGSCGTIVVNMQMKVIDESGVILGPNQKGEACFKAPVLMTCYYKNPEATRETIDAEGWLHTGDLVHYDEEGNVFITDRIKALIKYRGHHVSPALIEQVLQAHPAVLEAGVTSRPNDIDDEHPIAFVVENPSKQVSEEELLQLVADKLPDYMRLRGGIKFLEELPHTPSGKISRNQLKIMARTCEN